MRNSMKDPALQEVTLHALYHEGGVLPCMHYIMRVAFLVFLLACKSMQWQCSDKCFLVNASLLEHAGQ